MTSKSTTRATLRAHAARLETIANQSDGGEGSGDLDVAAATRAITETLSELYGGRVEDVAVEEGTDEIVIRFSTVESSFEDDELEDAEAAVANAAPDYETWLRANSDRLEDVGDAPAGATYGEWLAARGGK